MLYPLLATADIHLTSSPADDYRWSVFDDLIRIAKQRSVRRIAILGDLCHYKDSHDSILVNRVVDAFVSLTQVVDRVVLLTGNHDYTDPELPFFSFLDRIPKVQVISKTTGIEMGQQRDEIWVPHMKNLAEHISEFGPHLKRARYVFTHQCYDGAVSNGIDLSGTSPRIFDPHLPEDAQVFAGDIHNHQKVGRVEYIGAPHPINFGDHYDSRFLLLEPDAMKWIPREAIRKLKVEIESVDSLHEVEATPGLQLKVVLRMPRSEFVDWEKRKLEVIEHCRKRSIHLHSVELKEKILTRVKLGESKPAHVDNHVVDHSLVVERFASDAGIDPVYVPMGQRLARK